MNTGTSEKELIRPEVMNTLTRWIIILFIILYTVGTLGHIFPSSRPLMLMLTPYMLILSAAAGFFPVVIAKDTKMLQWALITFLITFLLEAVGTATGDIFGAYTYGETLGWKLFDVPVIIGINWVLVILGILSWTERYFKMPVAVIFAAAFGTTLFDFIMEPIAMEFDYWMWEGGIIPLQNYAAWWIISLASAALYKVLKLRCRHKLPAMIVLIEAVFFLILRITVI
ncbi:MAG: carotenoid biosynthesis protein [Spirochaetales bacterium]|nr:carotenoid biosynthesis protein [Spirochaetales bacterium]